MRMRGKCGGLILLVFSISLPVRLGAQTATAKETSAQRVTFTGKLERVMAIGAETTGWAIQVESETTIEGQPVKSVEIDYHGPKKLDRLENKRVQASGKLAHRHGVETGERTVLEVSSIREAKAK
jgi:hypothetical protein